MERSFSSVRPNFTSDFIRIISLPRAGPESPTRLGISFRCRSRTSPPCGADFMMSETRMMAVAPPAEAEGIDACGGACGTGDSCVVLADGAAAWGGGAPGWGGGPETGLAAPGALLVPGGTVACLG